MVIADVVLYIGRRHFHVPRYIGSDAKGDHGTRSIEYEGEDYCAAGKKVLDVDWWLDLGVVEHLSADVDFEAGV